MKKLFTILLLISLLVPACGTFLWVYLQKMQLRSAVKEQLISGMPEEKLVLLKFTIAQSRAELRWEHSREFEYRRQMYDVVKSETSGDTTYYLCWPDHAETELNRQLERLTADAAGKDPERNLPFKRLFDFFQSLYYTHVPIWPEPAVWPCPAVCHIALKDSALFYPPPAPPPRFA